MKALAALAVIALGIFLSDPVWNWCLQFAPFLVIGFCVCVLIVMALVVILAFGAVIHYKDEE
jgi:hypothetical protein